MAEFKFVGTSVPRGEGSGKVSGRTIYAADLKLADLLWAKILRSPHPHARIRRVEVSQALKVPGVRAIITGADVKGYLVGKQIRDLPVLCWDKARFVGDRIAAVAAESVDAAEEATQLIDVDYEVLPAVYDPLEAMAPGAPLVHDKVAEYDGAPKKILAAELRNGLTRLSWKKGDVEQGFRDADLVFEHTFRVPARHQGYLEPHAATVAIEPDGRVQVWASVKNPFGRTQPTVQVFELARRAHPHERGQRRRRIWRQGRRCRSTDSLFSRAKTGRPVKIVMTYAEELSASNPAHPPLITIKVV